MLDLLLLVLFACGGVYLLMHLRVRRLARSLDEARKSERRFRDLTELSADWFWETDATNRITWISGGALVAEPREQRQTRQRLQGAIQLTHVDAMHGLAFLSLELQRAHAFDRHLATLALHVAHRNEAGVEAE